MKKENSIILSLTAILAISHLLISCDNEYIYAETVKIPEYTWHADNILKFEAPVEDTINAFDINLVIRTYNDYPYRNLFLFITTSSPERLTIRDTVEYFLADEKGDWYGSGLGDVNDLSVPFKSNIIFPAGGIYTFRIQQGMRESALRGITDIGIQIKKR